MNFEAIQKNAKQFRRWVFMPPYYGVPWVVWFYALFSCLYMSYSGVFAGLLTGYDDHVRMTQILNWVNGAGWYDRTIMRVNAPEGFTTIWSRLVDIPYAVVILLTQSFLGQKKAALFAAFAIPFAELGVLFPTARYFARPLMGKDKARLIVLFLMFTSVINYTDFSMSGFYTGEVSHHSWYIILALLLFGATARLAAGVAGPPPMIFMGAASGLLESVGIEGFPLIAGAVTILTFVAWLHNRPLIVFRAMQAMIFGGMFALALLPVHQSPEYLFSVSFAEPSLLGPILDAAAAAFLWATWLILRRIGKHKIASMAAIAVAAAIALAGIVLAFPGILAGPAAALSPDERIMAFREHAEAGSLYKAAGSWLDFLLLVVPTLIAVTAGIIAARTAPTMRRRAIALSYLGFASLTGGLAEVIARYIHHAMTTACALLLWAWDKVKNRLSKNRNYSLAALLVFIALGPLWMLLLPACLHDSGFGSHIALFPAKVETFPDPCQFPAFGRYLNQHYDKNTLLLVPGAESSRMLYYSGLKIDFLNNYPSQNKFIDNQVFFGTQDEAVAKDIARRHKVDLVAVCFLASTAPPLKPGEEPMMFERLEHGAPPDWLKQVRTGVGGYYQLYEVDKKALMK